MTACDYTDAAFTRGAFDDVDSAFKILMAYFELRDISCSPARRLFASIISEDDARAAAARRCAHTLSAAGAASFYAATSSFISHTTLRR